jgi:hypothetical protein
VRSVVTLRNISICSSDSSNSGLPTKASIARRSKVKSSGEFHRRASMLALIPLVR